MIHSAHVEECKEAFGVGNEPKSYKVRYGSLISGKIVTFSMCYKKDGIVSR